MAQILYDVDMVNQQFSPVCWLACAAMVIQFKRRMTPSASQLGQDSANDFRTPGLTVPNPVPGDQIERMYTALRRMGFFVSRSSNLRNPRTLAMRPTPGVPPSAQPSEELIYRLLSDEGPFILFHHVGAFWYGPTRPNVRPEGAHAVVITGIETNRHRVYFNNPWGDRNVPTTASSIVGAIRRWEAANGLPIAYL